MKIATWNVERLKIHNRLPSILSCCQSIDADILVLTETDSRIAPMYPYSISTPMVNDIQPSLYKKTENRVTIFSRYEIVREHPTHDPYSSICVELVTENGNLLVYGTIIGIYGNRRKDYFENAKCQFDDIENLLKLNIPICICGDFNCSFADNYYYTKKAREYMLHSIKKLDLQLLTEGIYECIDHIAISNVFLKKTPYSIEEWNTEKLLSDHKGIVVNLNTL